MQVIHKPCPPIASRASVELTAAGRYLVGSVLADPPAHDVWPTPAEQERQLDALADEFPRLVTKNLIGHAGSGRPIYDYVVGDGERHALVVGGVHSDEPVGNITAVHLAHQLASDDALRAHLRCVWHVVPCVDPDAMDLNAWISDPVFTRNRDEFRSARHEQPMELFPPPGWGDDDVDESAPGIREMLSLKGLVDDIYDRLAFVVLLHNAEKNSAFYVSEGVRRLPAEARAALYGDLVRVPPHWGLPVVRNVLEELDLEIGAHPGIADMDGFAVVGRPRFSLAHYVPDVPVLSPDIAMWVSGHEWDERPAGQTLAELLTAEMVPPLLDAHALLDPGLRATLRHAEDVLLSPVAARYLAAAQTAVRLTRGVADVGERMARTPAARRIATRSERHSLSDIVYGYTLRRAAVMTRQAIDAAFGDDFPRSLIPFHVELLQRELQWAQQAEDLSDAWAPPSQAAAAQVASVLVMAEHLKGGR